MFKTIWVLLGVLLSMTSWSYTAPNLPAPSQIVTQNRTVPPFSQILISGSMNVVMHANAKKPGLVLHGDARDLAHISVSVKQGRLIVSFFGQYPKFHAVNADIYANQINDFNYQGAGVVSGKIHSNALNIDINNPGTTKLDGNITLRKLFVRGHSLVEIKGIKTNHIVLGLQDKPHVYLEGMIRLGTVNMKGNGFLSMYWVKNERLNVHLNDNATLQLAGFVNVLEVKARGRSHFLGRYLRARRAFVKTYDHALAEINVIHREHTLASGASDIQIYHLPEMREDFMAYNGAVLDMRQWNLPEYQNETVYNKP